MAGLIVESSREADRLWYRMEFVRQRYALAMSREMARIFRRQKSDISALGSSLNDLTVQSALSITADRMSQVIRNTTEQASKAVESIADDADRSWKKRDIFTDAPSSEYSSYIYILQNWLNNFSAQEVVKINDSTRRQIREILAKNASVGGTVQDAAKMIDRLYLDQIIPNRSYTIATTEIATGVNATSQHLMQGVKINVEKEWITARDTAVRDSHIMMEGIRVGSDESFKVPSKSGYELMPYPAYQSASAENRINCRCTQVYVRI